MNKYPLWKYLLIIAVLAVGTVYAIPNLYAPDPAIQISTESSGETLPSDVIDRIGTILDEAGIEHFGGQVDGNTALVRLNDQDLQLRAQAIVKRVLGDGYVVAVNLAPTTPDWLRSLGAGPMKLGLDLSGGVHFLLEVDTQAAVAKRLDVLSDDIKSNMREQRLRGIVTIEPAADPEANPYGSIRMRFNSEELREEGLSLIRSNYSDMIRRTEDAEGDFYIWLDYSAQKIAEIEDYAVDQNRTTLNNRVNELGVAEPLVQRQGRNRIVVELPGIQDTAEAKRILGKTANLEFRLVAKFNESSSSKETFEFRDPAQGASIDLERRIIVTGDRVSNAAASFDENGRPQVNISLDGQGGKLMHRATRDNIKRRMAILFIERKTRTRYEQDAEGNEVVIKEKYDVKEVLSAPTIQSALGSQFRITGLDSPVESSELALLLRAGALAAPIEFVEERTVGPSLGAENIQLGLMSAQIGMALVVIFMLVYYRLFGLFANIALFFNIVLVVACMSMLSATLTLPGIAGIVLTVGMAVDANVLIFARIREEIASGSSPQKAISAGYDRAMVTILDANITTLLTAVILYAIGTGPVRGFAVTLSLGIITSMFTAIIFTRSLVNLTYGGRRVKKLSI
jgi:preprotein translocase subunit SecD